MNRKIRAEVKYERDFRAFAELARAHRVILENAVLQHEGWFYECLTANILAAFKMEAYFNHVGKLFWPEEWDGKERRWSKWSKFEKICDKINLDRSDIQEEYDTLKKVFKFRDDVAHARSCKMQSGPEVIEGDRESLRRSKPLTDWEKLCTIEFAQCAYDHTESLILKIHTVGKLDPDLLCPSGHSYSSREITDE